MRLLDWKWNGEMKVDCIILCVFFAVFKTIINMYFIHCTAWISEWIEVSKPNNIFLHELFVRSLFEQFCELEIEFVTISFLELSFTCENSIQFCIQAPLYFGQLWVFLEILAIEKIIRFKGFHYSPIQKLKESCYKKLELCEKVNNTFYCRPDMRNAFHQYASASAFGAHPSG